MLDQAQPRGPHSRSVACTEVTIVASQERSVPPWCVGSKCRTDVHRPGPSPELTSC